MAEIDDATLAKLRELQKLIGETQANPDARKHLDKAIKAVRPHIETEEDVAERYAAPVKQKLEEVEKKFSDYVSAQEKREREWAEAQEKREMHNAFADLRKKGGYTDDGINEIADLMVKRNIVDPYAAAALYDQMHPAAPEIATSSYEPQRWQIAPEDDVKRLFTDPNGWEAEAIGAALRDSRAGQVH